MSSPRLSAFTFLLFSTLGISASAQQPAEWKDPSPHRIRFVEVDNDVRLEVLDWGGSGRPVLLLAGLGNTAHVFDEFAPRLAKHYRVYGITRRGFGASGAPQSGYASEELAEDVFRVITTLKLKAPVVAGHSMAGDELNVLGAKHADRIAALIYLDAAADRTMRPSAEYQAVNRSLPPLPQPQPSDIASYSALRAYTVRHGGSPLPEGEIRASYNVAPDGSIGDRTVEQRVAQAIMAGVRKPSYELIKIPALALYAVPGSARDLMRPWYNADDPAVRDNVEKLYALTLANIDRVKQPFAAGIARGHVVELPGARHHLFISNEADVLREMRAFIATVR